LALGDVGADEAALVVAGTGKGGWSDDIPRGVDVRQTGLIPIVDVELSALVG